MRHFLRLSVLSFVFAGLSLLGGTAEASFATGVGDAIQGVVTPISDTVQAVTGALGIDNIGISGDGDISVSGEFGGIKFDYDSNGNCTNCNGGNTGLIFPEDRPPSIDLATNYENSFRRVVVNIVNFILFFLGLVGMIMVTYGGFLYLTAGGDDGQQGKAKSILLYSAIGIFVILAAFSLSNTLLTAAEPDATGDPEKVGYEN